MFKKEIMICMLATLFVVGLLGTAFAENRETSLIGTDQFSFDSPNPMINYEAAKNYDYNQEHLAKVGTEGGDWQFKFDAPETKADMAAKNYVYDHDHLALIGTEGGDHEFKFDNATPNSKNHKTQVTAGNKPEALCSDC
jgi:hypothetical protein